MTVDKEEVKRLRAERLAEEKRDKWGMFWFLAVLGILGAVFMFALPYCDSNRNICGWGIVIIGSVGFLIMPFTAFIPHDTSDIDDVMAARFSKSLEHFQHLLPEDHPSLKQFNK